jgi:quinol monooxygenase YgiN
MDIANKASNGAGNGPVTFVITFRVKPEHAEEFHALLSPVLDAMRHEATFINAVLHRDAQDPSRVMLYETWSDLDDVVNEQIHRDYRQAYWDRLPELLMETQRIETWYPTRIDGNLALPGGQSHPTTRSRSGETCSTGS